MALLITPTLLNSIDWFQNCPQNWKMKAYDDLKRMLSRDYSQPIPDPVKKGIEFENRVYEILQSGKNIDQLQCSDYFKQVLRICQGGKFQKKSKKIMSCAATYDYSTWWKNNKSSLENSLTHIDSFCLYGKIDVFFPDRIIDIKTTNNFSSGKYLKTFQHKIYCYNEKIEKFDYLVVVMDGNTITDVKTESYTVQDWDELREEIGKKIISVMQFFHACGKEDLLPLYLEKFCLYN